jgi:hypothetical protein
VIPFWPRGPAPDVTLDDVTNEETAGLAAPLQADALPAPKRGEKTSPSASAKKKKTAPKAGSPPVPPVLDLYAELRQNEREWQEFTASFVEQAQFDQILRDQRVMLDGSPVEKNLSKEIRAALLQNLKAEIGPKPQTTPGGEDWHGRVPMVMTLLEDFLPSLSSGELKLQLARAEEPTRTVGFRAETTDGNSERIRLRCRSKRVRITLEVQPGVRPEAWELYRKIGKRAATRRQ